MNRLKKNTLITQVLIICILTSFNACAQKEKMEDKKYSFGEKIQKSEAEWKKELTEEEYRVTRQKGTERAFTGKLLSINEDGVYTCACCGLDLFESDTKFKSGTGWPSFYKPIKDHVEEIRDTSMGMIRREVVCARCGCHLGHVFDDGPQPTGQRYCVNSVSLDFEKEKK